MARTARLCGAPLLSAAALYVAWYPLGLDAAVWVALVPLLVWVDSPGLTRTERAAGLALFGVVHHGMLASPALSVEWWGWGEVSGQGVERFLAQQRVFAGFVVAGIALWLGLYLALAGQWLRGCRRRPLLAVVAVPAVWVALVEYVGHATILGFGWGYLGNRLHGHDALRQVASVAGVYGLSFLVVMVNAALASWVGVWLDRRAGRPGAPGPWAATAVAVALLACAAAFGAWRLGGETGPRAPVLAAALQGARSSYAPEDFTHRGLDRLYPPLLERAADAGARLAVLPESVWFRALAEDGTTSPWADDAIAADEVAAGLAPFLEAPGRVVVLGMDVVRGGEIYNSSVVFGRTGLLGVYDKRRRVPFSEFSPPLVGRLSPQNRLQGEAFAYAPGGPPTVVATPLGALGAFICQEMMFPELVRDAARGGAEILVTTGNDGVFASPVLALEQARLARIRATEHGRFLVRSMKTGVSAIVDPVGRVVAEAAIGEEAVVLAAVERRTTPTVYTRFGPWLVWACGALVVAARMAAGKASQTHPARSGRARPGRST